MTNHCHQFVQQTLTMKFDLSALVRLLTQTTAFNLFLGFILMTAALGAFDRLTTSCEAVGGSLLLSLALYRPYDDFRRKGLDREPISSDPPID